MSRLGRSLQQKYEITKYIQVFQCDGYNRKFEVEILNRTGIAGLQIVWTQDLT